MCSSYERVLNDLSLSYDLAPTPPPSLINKLSLILSLPVCRRSRLLTGEGEGGAKSYDSEKAWFSICHSILSEVLLKERKLPTF